MPSEQLTLREAERKTILESLRASGWNVSQSARNLNIHRRTLQRKIKALKVKR